MSTHSSPAQVEILGQQITRIEYRGQQVVTYGMIDGLHGRPEGTAKRAVSENKARFVANEDFFELTSYEIRTMSKAGILPKRTARATVFSRRGYLKIVKSFNDDTAWEVFGDMIDRYFIVEELAQAVATEIQTELDLGQPSDGQQIASKDLAFTTNELKGALLGYLKKGISPILDGIRSQVADFRDRAFSGLRTIHNNVKVVNAKIDAIEAKLSPNGEVLSNINDWYSVSRIYGEIADVHLIPRQAMLSSAVVRSLDSFVLRSHQNFHMSEIPVAGRSVRIWHVEAVREWFEKQGRQMIADHIARNAKTTPMLTLVRHNTDEVKS